MLIIVDIDLTLADARERIARAGKMPLRTKKAHFQKWLDSLQSAEDLLGDEPLTPLVNLIETLEATRGYKVVYLTGRSEIYRDTTQTWLRNKTFLPPGPLFMRKRGDWRSARDYKEARLLEIQDLLGLKGGIAIDDDSEGDCSAMYIKHGFVHLKVII